MADELLHYGTKRHSGRYPWGSGDNPYQHNEEFLKGVRDMKAQGISEKEIAEFYGLGSISSLRARVSALTNENRKADISRAMALKAEGMNNSEIAREMGTNESTVRGWLNSEKVVKENITDQTLQILRDNVKEKKYIDVGKGTEYQLNISEDKLKKCVKMLQDEEGYSVVSINIVQMGTGKETTMKVLAAPGTTRSEVSLNRNDISVINDRYDPTSGEFIRENSIKPMVSIDGKRVAVRYSEDGGKDKDGVIEIRKGVQDLSLGNAQYAQVRILVDGDRYLKGMAMYSDDIPDGYDILFNTNKTKDIPKEEVLKKIKNDAEMSKVLATVKPGGQRYYEDISGNRQQSAINIVREEGDWSVWNKSLASQFLSKQPTALIKKQLRMTYDDKYAELDDILSIENPEIKHKLLIDFADQCDADSAGLKAAALPRQSTKVILPITSLADNEIYAPGYKQGEKVVLVRYPHGGKFEIPELVVNNKNSEANSVMRNATDAVGINSKVAEKLSGADFDGDTVIVIPNNSGAIKSSPSLEGLKDFDPKERYPYVEGMKVMSTTRIRNIEMGKASNLITDMTLLGASDEELAAAVRHSMVVIDAYKHKLNYKQSEIDNNIPELRKKYQGRSTGGASTLLSRANSQKDIPERKEDYYKIDPNTGEKIFSETGRTYTDKYGKEKLATQKISKMESVDDARYLMSDAATPVEQLYASYANGVKSLANVARKESLTIEYPKIEKSAKDIYSSEVESINSKLSLAKANAPFERQAQILANQIANERIASNPDMDKEAKKKLKGRALTEARDKVGAKKQSITLTDNEWKAIEARAISSSKINEVLENMDSSTILEYAMPKNTTNISNGKIAIAKNMDAAGYSISEIADRIGVSSTTAANILNGKIEGK